MKILLTGASGQLGRELRPELEALGPLTAVDRQVLPGDDDTLQSDLSDGQRLGRLLDRVAPEVIVNAAAYTAVDRAEDEVVTAFRVNAGLPRNLASWAAQHGALLLHYSTDYVFPGNADRPYTEDDRPGPLNVYGESKLEGETAVRRSGCRHLLLRTSWVYSGHGSNFLLTMLRLAGERSRLDIVDDQRGCPTWARNLARASRLMLERATATTGLDGLYHYCDEDEVSWFGFASAIFSAAEASGRLSAVPELNAVLSGEFPQKARRPAYSVLDTSRAVSVFGIRRPGLAESLRECLQGARIDER